MADTVTSRVLFSSKNRYVIKLTNTSDGTGESLVKKVDVSTLTGPNGSAPENVSLIDIIYDIQGFSKVTLYWDRDSADTTLAVLSGHGAYSYKSVGGLVESSKGTAGTGDILLSTTGTTSGNSYDITLDLRLRDA